MNDRRYSKNKPRNQKNLGRNLKLWPMVEYEGKYSVPDEILAAIWHQMEKEGKTKKNFFDGSINSLLSWLEFIKNRQVFPVLIVDLDKKEIKGVAWLNTVGHDGVAEAHYFALGRYVRGGAELVLGYWKTFPGLRLIVGYTPESYKTPIKLLKKLGFKVIGTIPDYFHKLYENKREGAIVSYYIIGEKDANNNT